MKKTVLSVSRFAPVLLLTLFLSGSVVAQTSKAPSKKAENNEVTIRIIERNGNDVRETERTYRSDGMSEADRDGLVTKLVDSLKTTRKGGRRSQMTIIIENNDGNRVVTRDRVRPGQKRAPKDAYVQRGKLPRSGNDSWNNSTWRYEFRQNFDSLTDRMNRFKFEFPRDFDRQIARPFENWSQNFTGKPSSIRGLDAYPNNPDRNQLNVRFTAPAKGDVSIIVTNTKGKEVAKREIKNFSGEFFGQIDLGKQPQGTYFITVTQLEDGAVKRIVVE